MFDPITKYSTQILEPEIVPEIVRKAFKVAQTEKPGATFIDFPENVAEMIDGQEADQGADGLHVRGPRPQGRRGREADHVRPRRR